MKMDGTTWVEVNQRYVVAAFAGVKAALKPHAVRAGGEAAFDDAPAERSASEDSVLAGLSGDRETLFPCRPIALRARSTAAVRGNRARFGFTANLGREAQVLRDQQPTHNNACAFCIFTAPAVPTA